MANLFQDVIYLQIRRGWVSILYLGWSGRKGEWSGTPSIAYFTDPKGKPPESFTFPRFFSLSAR